MDITARRIKELRKAHKMSQSELAELVGYSGRSTVCTIEKNLMEVSVEKLTAIANVFGVSTEYLLGMDEHKAQEEELCFIYRHLGDEGKKKLIDFAKLLSSVPELGNK